MAGSNAPIFVVGFQRSGTTLTQALLGAHSRIASPPEMHFMFRISRFAARYGDLTDGANLRRVIDDALNPPVDLFADCGFDADRIFERVMRAGKPSMRAVLDAIMSDFADRHGKVRWSEKSPGQSVAQVHSLFPDAQIIHVVRDPRDVIASSLATPWTRESAHELAVRWRRFTIDNVRKGTRAGPGSFLQVRYEDLTRDPEAVLRVIFAFIGELYEPEILTDPRRRRSTIAKAAAPWQQRALEKITPAQFGGWRTNLDRRDQFVVQAIVHRELPMLGYASPSKRAVALGRLLDQPVRMWQAVRGIVVRHRLRDPARLERAIRSYLDEQGRAVTRQV